MMWFAGSVIVWSRSDAEKDSDGPCHLWQRTLIVQADDVDDATRKLEDFGKADAAANSGDQQEAGTPDDVGDELIYMGVRNVREIEALDGGAPEPIEVMYAELEVKDRADLHKFVAGNTIIARYIG